MIRLYTAPTTECREYFDQITIRHNYWKTGLNTRLCSPSYRLYTAPSTECREYFDPTYYPTYWKTGLDTRLCSPSCNAGDNQRCSTNSCLSLLIVQSDLSYFVGWASATCNQPLLPNTNIYFNNDCASF